MAEFSRQAHRFFFTGLSTFPADALPAGKLPWARNIRSYAEGEITPRCGLDSRSNAMGAPIHTITRLNDATPFNGGAVAIRVVGVGTAIFTGDPTGVVYASFDTGYSGDPLTTFAAQPPRSPRPWLYVADANKYQKFLTDGSPQNVGIAQPSAPSTEPAVAIGELQRLPHEIIDDETWTLAGATASAPVQIARCLTTISQILYDDGQPGYASVVAADFTNIVVGTRLTLSIAEATIVTDITIAIADTTVAAIIYDSGTTGYCTVQPAGSLGVGQLDAPSLAAYRRRAYQGRLAALGEQTTPDTLANRISDSTLSHNYLNLPQEVIDAGEYGGLQFPVDTARGRRRIRQVDFPVNCLIEIGGELSRILSVAIGPDGRQSFRCFTSTTITAGATIVGLPAFRCYLTMVHVPGAVIADNALQQTITYPAPATDETTTVTGGIQTAFVMNCSQFANGQAVLPEDEIHLAVKVDRLTEVTAIRLYIDVDQTTNDFVQNYFFYEWRANDIITAIQSTNAASVTPLVTVRQTVVTNEQLQSGTLGLRHRYGPELEGVEVVSTSALSTELALGNNQWIALRAKVGALVRVGTDTTRTLADGAAFEILVSATAPAPEYTPPALTIEYDDFQIYGGSGPDVEAVGDPYVYAYRYRSSETGAVSNPSPPSRGGVIPQRQPVFLTPTPSSDPQVDLIDWFRFGSTLSEWTYLTSSPNTGDVFTDDLMDSAIVNGTRLRWDNNQPWPVQDIPHTGTADVAGTAILRVGGDDFDTNWSPGSIIIVNGRVTTLYASPASDDLLHVVDSVGDGSAVEFTLPGPTILSQPLPRVWGDVHGVYFGCGDPLNPGTLYWTAANNPEIAPEANSLIVTPPSEPLQAGYVYNVFAGVFSSQDLYQILRMADGNTRVVKTPCGRGLWTPWAFCTSPQGVIFLAEDGIFVTQGGSMAQPVHSPDLRTIFPKDGVPGQAVGNVEPPDMTAASALRLSYIAGFVYFDYLGLDAAYHTLMIEVGAGGRWFVDETNLTSLRLRVEEPGEGVYDQIIGGGDGVLYRYDEDAFDDAGTDLPWAVYTPWMDQNHPRTLKQYGDAILDTDPQGSLVGLVTRVVTDNAAVIQAPITVGQGDTGRLPYILNLPDGGLLGRNIGLEINSSLSSADTGRPRLYLWETAFLLKADNTQQRATDWENLGYQGAKFVQGVVIRANTYGQDKVIEVQMDGGVVAQSFTINHDGEVQRAYPIVSTGWTPFVTQLIRIVGADDVDWQLLDYRFVWEPAPELATQWETQYTSNDLPGFQTVHDMVVGYEATAPMVFTLWSDDRTIVHVLPATGGTYLRYYQLLCPNKGKAVKYRWQTAEPARLYKRDLAMRVQGWGMPGGYQVISPFGGPSRADGAAI